MKALFDSDILVYRIGFTTEEEDEAIVKWRLEDFIGRALDTLKTNEYQHYLTSTDKSNFRFKLFPEYKAHRIQPKPRHYEYIRCLLTEQWDAKIVYNQEADDQLGIDQTGDTVICTIDKDLNQIPGWHFNFVTGQLVNISTLEAIRCFYEQTLVGDKSTDNVEGCPRIGKVKAVKILEGCQNENEMLEAVVDCYQGAYPENEWADRLLLAGNLLWVRRKPDQSWELSSGDLVSKRTLESFSEQRGLDSSLSQEDTNSLFLSSLDIIPQTLK